MSFIGKARWNGFFTNNFTKKLQQITTNFSKCLSYYYVNLWYICKKKKPMEMLILIIVLFVSAILCSVFVPNKMVSKHKKDSDF